MVVPDAYQLPRSLIESLERLSVSLVRDEHQCPLIGCRCQRHGIAGSCKRLCCSISSLLGSRGPSNDASGKISCSMCSSSSLALGACAPWSWTSVKMSASALCSAAARALASLRFHWSYQHTQVPTRFLIWSSIPVRSGFGLCPLPLLQLLRATRHHLALCERDTSVAPLGTELTHTHDGSFDFAHLEVIQIWRPSLSFIGTDGSASCFSLCPLVATRWGCLLGSKAIHSKSRGEHTCSSAQLSFNTCATYQSLEWRNESLCWIADKMYPVLYSSSSSSSMERERSQVSMSWMVLETWLTEVATGGVIADYVGVATSFTLFFPLSLSLSFLSLLMGSLSLFVSLKTQSLIMWPTNTSAHKAACLLSFACARFLLVLVVFAFSCQDDLHVVWPFSVTKSYSRVYLILWVVSQELKSHCCHHLRRYPDSASGVELAPMKVLYQGRELSWLTRWSDLHRSIPTYGCSLVIDPVRSRRLWALRWKSSHWGLRPWDSVLTTLCLERISCPTSYALEGRWRKTGWQRLGSVLVLEWDWSWWQYE